MTLTELYAKGEGRSINKATKRVFDVLASFIGATAPLGASELSRQLGLSRNMVHRALVTLAEEGYLLKSDPGGRYVLSYRLVELQNTAVAPPDLREIARPCLSYLSEATGETAQLCVRSGDVQTIIDGIEGGGPVVVRVKLGRATPLHASNASRAILAACTDGEIEDYLKRNAPLTRYTPATLTEPDALWKEIEAIRNAGYALSFGDYSPGTIGVAIAIVDFDARPFGAIVVGGPASRLTDAWIHEHLETIRPAVANLNSITSLYQAP